MTDDLVTRLREKGTDEWLHTLLDEAANRIEQLEAALRDQFAMAALTGIITNPVYDEMTCEIVAKISYSIADAMLEARKKKKDDPTT